MIKLNELTLRIAIPVVLIILLFNVILPVFGGYIISCLTFGEVHLGNQKSLKFSETIQQTYAVAGILVVIALLSFIIYVDRTVAHPVSQLKVTLKQTQDNLEQCVEERIQLLKLISISLTHEVAERQHAQMELQLANEILEHSLEGIMITDAQRNILKINPAFTDVTGYTAEECIGRNPRILNSGIHDEVFYQEMWRSLEETGRWESEIWNRRKNGEAYPQWHSISAIRNENGEITHYVTVFHDITDIKHSQEQIKYQAYHDALTGLPNRQLFYDRLEMALAYAKRNKRKVGVMFLDLDKFRNINDSQGNTIGDLILKEVATRLKRCCRHEDTVSRFGDDEFTIILPEIKEGGHTIEVAQRILESFSEPFVLKGYEIMSSASIGITIYPTDGEDVPTLVKNADIAMARAKERGRNTYELYTEAMYELVLERVKLENSLRKALKNDEFRVYYQPQVDIKTGIISGMEALVRWQRSENELIFPDKFISVAEDTGLIVPLGEWVLRIACRQIKIWHDTGFESLSIAVNLSAKQFQDKHLVQIVQNILKETGLAPEFLCLEITENTVMRDVESAVKMMSALKDIGVHLSIDDFGTGYSSLNYLKRFPLHEIKIDKSFVREIPRHHDDVAIAKTILSLAHSLNLKVLAEGVETQTQLEFMRANRCNGIQGFLFSKAIQANEVTTLLQEGKKL
jgi:diguanylate cyclase (GGDEF)-like protein/PAS domain S-box-containing protein